MNWFVPTIISVSFVYFFSFGYVVFKVGVQFSPTLFFCLRPYQEVINHHGPSMIPFFISRLFCPDVQQWKSPKNTPLGSSWRGEEEELIEVEDCWGRPVIARRLGLDASMETRWNDEKTWKNGSPMTSTKFRMVECGNGIVQMGPRPNCK